MKTVWPRLLAAFLFVICVCVVASAQAVEPIRIMPIGDSITAGYTDNPDWNVPFGFGYRSGLYTKLNAANYPFAYVGSSPDPWDGRYGVPKYVSAPDLRPLGADHHRGYGGKTTGYLNTYISDWLQSDSPDVVLLMTGINNISRTSSGYPTAAINELDALVEKIVYQRPGAHLIIAQITPYSTYVEPIMQYNDYIKNTLVPRYAGYGKNITTVDQYTHFGSGTTINPGMHSNGINHPTAAGYALMAQTWFDGIQALGAITHDAGPAKAALANGGFESPQFASNTHTINPVEASWAFITGASGAGSGIDHGVPYGGTTNCTAASGTQMGFLQGAGTNKTTSIAQDMTGLIVGKTYSFDFSAKAIAGYSGVNPFSVSINNSLVDFGGKTLLMPAATTTYTSYGASFIATASTMSLRFFDQGNVATGKVTWIDGVKLGMVTPAGSNLVANGGFEATSFADNSHNVNPSGTGWRFTPGGTTAGSGVDRGNPYGGAITNATPFLGAQYGFIQGRGQGNGVTSIEQDVAGFVVGQTYVLSFQSAGILGSSGANPFFVSLGENEVDFHGSNYISPSASYGLFTSTPFVATSTSMTLRFYDGGDVPVGFASWIDDVQISVVPEGSTGVALLGLAAVSLFGVITRWGRKSGVGRPRPTD